MRRVYFEPSAINRFVNRNQAGSSLRQKLAASDSVPVVGLHVIYELARTFLTSEGHERGRTLFLFLQDLDPSYSPGSGGLLVQEVLRLRTGAAVLPFLNHIDQVATRAEVARLASGTFDDRARQFLLDRENDVKTNHPRMTHEYIRDVKSLRSANPAAAPKFRSFDDAQKYLWAKVPELVRDILRASVTRDEAAELSVRLDTFPALRSAVNANLYLMFICIGHGVSPALDKLDDYRHIIEASYSDAIVADDEQLRRTVPHINPNLRVMALNDV